MPPIKRYWIIEEFELVGVKRRISEPAALGTGVSDYAGRALAGFLTSEGILHATGMRLFLNRDDVPNTLDEIHS